MVNTRQNALYIKNAKGKYGLILRFLYVRLFLRKIILNKHGHLKNDFKHKTKENFFSEFWFDDNIPYWHYYFEQKMNEKNLKALEIGSFEGRSSYYILSTFENLQLTCVDTWGGSGEQETKNWTDVENNFDANMKSFYGRVLKFKCNSSEWFGKNRDKVNYYDLIYIDGSHYYKDVKYDAENCWKLLKPGGTMIFDDYLWCHYKTVEENPIFGINQFLSKIKLQFKILHVESQLFLEKKY